MATCHINANAPQHHSSTPGHPKIQRVRPRRRQPPQCCSSARVQETFVPSFPSTIFLTYLDHRTTFIHNSRSTSLQARSNIQSRPLHRPHNHHCVSPPKTPISVFAANFQRLTTTYLMFLNKKHASRRQALGKSAVIVDRSMMNSQERAISDEVDEANGGPIYEKAFDDITDLKNEDFIFVY